MSELKRRFKQIADRYQLAADMEWYLYRRYRFRKHDRFRNLDDNIRKWAREAQLVPARESSGKRVFIFSMIKIWIQHSAALSLVFDRLGHEVSLAYLPYHDWFTDSSSFDDNRLNHIFGECLRPLSPMISVQSMYSYKIPSVELPEDLSKMVELISERDYQYSRQVEEVDKTDPLFLLRQKRNRYAAARFLSLLQQEHPDVAIIPNGMILEFGVLYEVARYLGIPAVTYEFGEQRDKVWISQDKPVMFQNTDEMWGVFGDQPFTEAQQTQVEELFASRKGASLWRQFSRQWQEIPSEGEAEVKTKLELDERPVVLMAANVIGDSLTLGRQVYSADMTEWISRTLEFFRDKPEVQFILRIHPGERYTDGPSVEDIVRERVADVPDHFKVISANDKVNTYDLVAVADLGLTYTTTVGMEMAMSGLPVIVSGNTHYRGKGFTLDPASWEEYFSMIKDVLSSPDKHQYSDEKIKTAWHYAYCFFFDYPFDNMWHLRGMPTMIDKFPIDQLFSDEGWQRYGGMLNYLLNETSES